MEESGSEIVGSDSTVSKLRINKRLFIRLDKPGLNMKGALVYLQLFKQNFIDDSKNDNIIDAKYGFYSYRTKRIHSEIQDGEGKLS